MTASTGRPASRLLYEAREGGRPFTAADLWNIPRVAGPVPSPDGRSVAVTVTTHDTEANRGEARLWLVPLDGGAPRVLTAPGASIVRIRFRAWSKRNGTSAIASVASPIGMVSCADR